uniref:Putative uncharacterized protein YFR052C-A n=1 Tax=Saccharomyces cerevisiae (strain ATCC 204508 / S288c) TaxID=559292 RepID=YF052_YEAST|nr:RecName: Full=Putative uncharacterized protein YFR052C-A [Saccharomyces cerevisiae S288C]AHX39292.1 hypothetical protein YFR052C-A [Saccharomyces cerevisiae]
MDGLVTQAKIQLRLFQLRMVQVQVLLLLLHCPKKELPKVSLLVSLALNEKNVMKYKCVFPSLNIIILMSDALMFFLRSSICKYRHTHIYIFMCIILANKHF